MGSWISIAIWTETERMQHLQRPHAETLTGQEGLAHNCAWRSATGRSGGQSHQGVKEHATKGICCLLSDFRVDTGCQNATAGATQLLQAAACSTAWVASATLKFVARRLPGRLRSLRLREASLVLCFLGLCSPAQARGFCRARDVCSRREFKVQFARMLKINVKPERETYLRSSLLCCGASCWVDMSVCLCLLHSSLMFVV